MPFSWNPSLAAETPGSQDTPPPVTPYAPYRNPLPASDGLRAEFLDFALDSVNHHSSETKEEWARVLLQEWSQLIPTEQQNLVQQIRKVLGFWSQAEGQVAAINRSQSAAQARPRWQEASRRASILGLAIDTLKRMWDLHAPPTSRFGQCISERKKLAQNLKRDADLMKKSIPSSAQRSSAAFDALVDRQEALKAARARKQLEVDWSRVRRLEAERQRNAKPAGIRAIPLRTPDWTWRPIQDMRGGMGTIQVWGQDNGGGLIADRVVVKDTIIRSRSIWETSTTWYGDKSDRVPMEFWAHSKMDTGGKYIVHLASSQAQVNEERMLYRMWLEYCPNGDLSELISRHRSAERRIPIDFVIYTFKALIDCCLRMERGTVGKSSGEWEQIVHRDLKPPNILLGLPRATFPSYPEPKMADFGLSMVTNPDDEMNPSLYNLGGGTQGYLAPEQFSFINPMTNEPVDDFKLLAPANVWGVASIVLCLLERFELNIATQPDYMPGGTWQYRVSDAARSIYQDADLLDMVDRCLEYQPADRPTPEALRKWITKKIAADPWLSVESWGGEHPVAFARVVEPKTHKHYIGMSFNEITGLPPGAPYPGGGARERRSRPPGRRFGTRPPSSPPRNPFSDGAAAWLGDS
ncbi:uncharacterized protein RHO25_009102 [Cercospora beticola]|uniref:non-specific serine/threonine protein kinase n=1 Tax=Cercospora beticola TaxID=122368 RepID=A0ABZ0NY69_CERBT|nr:hypothetical protein RHO25_009102 [Cercospora beticola]